MRRRWPQKQRNRRKRRPLCLVCWRQPCCCTVLTLEMFLEDSDDEVPPVELTIFVYVEKPNPPRSTKGKVDKSKRYAQKGPFKLCSKDSYATFLCKVSTALPCPILHILEEKITWKPQTPQNAKPLPMGAETGYSTMIDALKAKRVGARVGIIIMPPPKKPNEDMVSLIHIRAHCSPSCHFSSSGTRTAQERLLKRDLISRSLSSDLQGTVLLNRRCIVKILLHENVLILIPGTL